MPYWCAYLEPNRERLALHVLVVNGYQAYLPRLRERRVIRKRKTVVTPPLFPGYCFIVATMQWHAARYSMAVRSLIMEGERPAAVADSIVESIRACEVNGLIELPRQPRFQRGDRVRVLQGPFGGYVGLYAGMKPRDRIAVLLALFGGQQRVELAAEAVQRVRA